MPAAERQRSVHNQPIQKGRLMFLLPRHAWTRVTFQAPSRHVHDSGSIRPIWLTGDT